MNEIHSVDVEEFERALAEYNNQYLETSRSIDVVSFQNEESEEPRAIDSRLRTDAPVTLHLGKRATVHVRGADSTVSSGDMYVMEALDGVLLTVVSAIHNSNGIDILEVMVRPLYGSLSGVAEIDVPENTVLIRVHDAPSYQAAQTYVIPSHYTWRHRPHYRPLPNRPPHRPARLSHRPSYRPQPRPQTHLHHGDKGYRRKNGGRRRRGLLRLLGLRK